MAEDKKSVGKCLLPNVRLSFPTLKNKRATVKDGKEKFSANFIIDPSTPQGKRNIELCKKAILEAEMETFRKTGVVKTIEDPKRIAFRPGAKFRNQEGEVYEGYAGMVAVSCNNDSRPQLWDRYKGEVDYEDIEDVFQGGFHCDAAIRFFCVNGADKGGRGLFCAVNGIRSHQRGEVFSTGGRISVDEFDDLDDDDDDLVGAEAGSDVAGRRRRPSRLTDGRAVPRHRDVPRLLLRRRPARVGRHPRRLGDVVALSPVPAPKGAGRSDEPRQHHRHLQRGDLRPSAALARHQGRGQRGGEEGVRRDHPRPHPAMGGRASPWHPHPAGTRRPSHRPDRAAAERLRGPQGAQRPPAWKPAPGPALRSRSATRRAARWTGSRGTAGRATSTPHGTSGTP